MISLKGIRRNIRQIFAITEKNTKMAFRFKWVLIIGYINTFIQLLFPIIIMQKFFSFQESFGPWTSENYLVYLFVGYNIMNLQSVVGYISGQFRTEKFTLTLQALMIAPFNKYNLLIGYVLAHLVSIFIPFIIFFIVCYILFPISIFTLLIILLFGTMLVLIFGGLGFILGGFSISNENKAKLFIIILGFFIMFSCVSYPYQVFPEYIQFYVKINPIYYIIDIIRLTWIENDVIKTLTSHYSHLIIIITLVVTIPTLGLYMFNYTYKKHGIVGY